MRTRWRKHTLALVLILALSLSPVSAQGLSVDNIEISGDVEDNIIWLNDLSDITVSAECKLDGAAITPDELYAEIYPPGYSNPSMKSPSDELLPYKFRNPPLHAYNNPDTNPYRVNVICKYDGLTASDEENLFVYELTLDIQKGEEIEVHQGGEFILRAELKLNGGLLTPSHNTFDVYYDTGDDGWEEFEMISDPVLAKDHQEIFLYVPLHDNDISVDRHNIKVKARYKVLGTEAEITDEVRNFIWVDNPIGIDIKENKIVCPANKICERNITAKVVFRAGSIEKFDTENVEAVLISRYKHQTVTVDDIYCDEGTEECNIIVTIPSYISSGDYDLFITVGYPSLDNYRYKSMDSIPFESVICLSGEFKNAAGKVVGTEMTLENIDTGEAVIAKTNSNGAYSIDLLPGVYNVAFKFAGSVMTKIYNVSITDFDLMTIPGNMIRFDSDHITSGAPSGVNMIKIVVLEFALPLSDVWVYIPYDSKKVNGREENLRVYRCVNWNFMKSSCTGEWERIPAEVHTIRDALEFTTDKSAAFLVGENNWLLFSKLELKDFEVYMGETVTVEGAVIDNDDNPVEGATVTLSFPEFNISRRAVTSGTGGFSARINAPYSTGNFLLGIEASKEPYSPMNDTRVVRVTKSSEIGITGVSDIERVNFNETLDLTLTVSNTGQSNFTKPIYLTVNGIPTDWYSLQPGSIEGLDVKERKDVSLKVRLTPDKCVSGCKKFNLVNFVAKSEEITHSISFSLELSEPSSGKEEGNQTEEEGGGGGLTGFMSLPKFSLPSMGGPYVSMTIIVILLLLIVNKKKAQEGIKKGVYRSTAFAKKLKQGSKKAGKPRSRKRGVGASFSSIHGISLGRKKPFRGDVLSPLQRAKSEVTGNSIISDPGISGSRIISVEKKSAAREKKSTTKKTASKVKKSKKKKFDWERYWRV